MLFFILTFVSVFGWESELKKRAEQAPPAWMLEQIQADFAKVATEDLKQEKLDASMKNSSPLLLVQYQIKGNKLSWKMDPRVEKHPRTNYYRKSLQNLMAVLPLPDMEFIISLGDSVDGANLAAPVFAFARDTRVDQKVLLIPDFEALQKSGRWLGRAEKGIKKYPWNKKKAKAFWRGAATGGTFNLDTFLSFPRSKLVELSLKNPELVDAKFALPLVQSDDPKTVLEKFADYFGPSKKVLSHFKYKYQVLVDGNSCAYSGAYWRWFSNCVVFKHDSPHIQWYYCGLLPNIHYIPCKGDFSDLPEKIKWAKAHDAEAKAISENAQKFARENLQKPDIYYYLYLTLKEYARIQHP